MTDPLQQISDADLRALAEALKGGRLAPPFTAVGVARLVGATLAGQAAARLSELADQGMRPDHVAAVLDAIVATRATRPVPEDAVELVWTGPDTAGATHRHTAVVVRELFAQAAESVVVAGFAVYQGREVFRRLAERMAERPELRVRLYLDVRRGNRDTAPESQIVHRFARRFILRDWPEGSRLPEVFYDPRSLSPDPARRSSLHAKCVVVDRRVALVTSANFTEAAQERNIEAGVVVRSPRFAARLADHFGGLADAGLIRRLDLPSNPGSGVFP
jgi:phosphatidylserine/phosphatidylglycerophosphate/cardiolipin synthase-like enzyme